ncbi:MAG: VWA domain-containing protein [Polyangiales bacterium]
MSLPAFADEGPSTPRTVLFLVDRSGSMEGRPMEAAKRAVRGSLRALGSKDRFNLIAFDDRLEALARSPRRFDDAALQAADAFVLALDARGGTEASQALKAVLTDNPKGVRASMPDKGEAVPGPRLRLVVFMTDGDVADAASVLRTAGDALNHTRLHVRIGDAVNHALLAELAELGGGTYTPVSSDEDLERAIHALKLAMDAPLWTGVTATLRRDGEERALDDLEPGPRLDLFAGRPVTVAWRGATRTDDTLVLRGLAPDGRVRTLEVPSRRRERNPTCTRAGRRCARGVGPGRFQPADDDALTTLGATYGLRPAARRSWPWIPRRRGASPPTRCLCRSRCPATSMTRTTRRSRSRARRPGAPGRVARRRRPRSPASSPWRRPCPRRPSTRGTPTR